MNCSFYCSIVIFCSFQKADAALQPLILDKYTKQKNLQGIDNVIKIDLDSKIRPVHVRPVHLHTHLNIKSSD